MDGIISHASCDKFSWEIKEVSTVTSTADTHGQLASGRILIEGHVLPCIVIPRDKDKPEPPFGTLIILSNGDLVIDDKLCFLQIDDETELEGFTLAICLLAGESVGSKWRWVFLLLRESKKILGVYERLGQVIMSVETEQHYPWTHGKGSKTTVTVV